MCYIPKLIKYLRKYLFLEIVTARTHTNLTFPICFSKLFVKNKFYNFIMNYFISTNGKMFTLCKFSVFISKHAYMSSFLFCCWVCYHHFSKKILLWTTPRFSSRLEMDSIIGGGPQMYHKVFLEIHFSRSLPDNLPSSREYTKLRKHLWRHLIELY